LFSILQASNDMTKLFATQLSFYMSMALGNVCTISELSVSALGVPAPNALDTCRVQLDLIWCNNASRAMRLTAFLLRVHFDQPWTMDPNRLTMHLQHHNCALV